MFGRGTDEIRTGFWRLYEPMGDRLLSFYALRREGGWLLFDAGLPGSMTGRLDEASWRGPIVEAIISHADADHLGDIATLKQRFPELTVSCHAADRPWIENHDRLVGERYAHARERYGHAYPDDLLRALRQACGEDFTVDRTLGEGDAVVGADESWRVLHAPGHSPGHLCLWCEATGELLLGDAVLGYGPVDSAGRPSMPPTHQFIRAYLDTIDRLVGLPVKRAMPCHWAPMDGEAFSRFLRQSREAVFRDLAAVQDHVDRAGRVTFEELLITLNRLWSVWPASEDAHYSYALSGYIEYHEAAGALGVEADGTIVRL